MTTEQTELNKRTRTRRATEILVRQTDEKYADRLLSNGWQVITPEGLPWGEASTPRTEKAQKVQPAAS